MEPEPNNYFCPALIVCIKYFIIFPGQSRIPREQWCSVLRFHVYCLCQHFVSLWYNLLCNVKDMIGSTSSWRERRGKEHMLSSHRVLFFSLFVCSLSLSLLHTWEIPLACFFFFFCLFLFCFCFVFWNKWEFWNTKCIRSFSLLFYFKSGSRVAVNDFAWILFDSLWSQSRKKDQCHVELG